MSTFKKNIQTVEIFNIPSNNQWQNQKRVRQAKLMHTFYDKFT